MKVCAALGLHIERFLAQEPEPINEVVIHRHEDDRWYDLTGFAAGPLGGLDRPLSETELMYFHNHGIATQMLMFRSRFPSSNFWAGIIELTEASESRQHPGEEFIYVLVGTLRVMVAEVAYDLSPGESICFNPNHIHSYSPGIGIGEKVSFLCFRMNTSGT
jgi:mannose-6-phosphate isomerase-like protein (cupin superfamily)